MPCKLALILMTILFVSCCHTSHAFSFPDSEHMKKLTKEAKKEMRRTGTTAQHSTPDSHSQNESAITAIELFASPIQPGGKYMLGINWMNVLRLAAPKLAAKMDKGRSLIDRYVDNLVESDPDVVAFRNDPKPNRNWKSELKALKEAKRLAYRASLLQTLSPH